MKNNNVDCYEMNSKEKYEYDKRKSIEYADRIVKSDLDWLKSERRKLLLIPSILGLGSVVLGYIAYSTRNIIEMCLAVGAAGISLVSAKYLYPSFKVNKDAIEMMRKRRDDIIREQMQKNCNNGIYDEDNNVGYKKK